MCCPNIGHDFQIIPGTSFCSETTGYFRFYFNHSQVTFCLIIIKRNHEVIQNSLLLKGLYNFSVFLPPALFDLEFFTSLEEFENKFAVDMSFVNNSPKWFDETAKAFERWAANSDRL